MRIPTVLIMAAAGLAAAATLATPAAAAPGTEGRFIVTVSDAHDSRQVAAEHRRNGAGIDFVYTAALNGFAGAMSQADLGALQRDRRVIRIERDGVVTASDTQSGATWGLDRIDQRSLPLSTTYSYASTGAGVTAYVIDTGIRLSHADFGGRAVSGVDTVDGDGVADDCHGHGTHVAGTVGGALHGVAKAVQLVAVRVLDCTGNGAWSGVIAGMDWVTAHHVNGAPAVANLSLGGGASSSVDAALQKMIDDGVVAVVAAGNGDRLGRALDACTSSPARVPAAITIGATTKTDAKTSWSNYGSCVDLFAPGAGITSTWHTSNTATNTISGTSMAAPHVAGAAARYLQANPGASPQVVRDALHAAATKGVVTSSSTANNHLLHADPGAVSGPANTPPTAGFSYACTGLTCSFTDGSTDADGTIAQRTWNFGDGSTSTATSPSRTYATGGSYTVTLTVTDNGGATGTTSRTVTVSAPSSGGITLTATGYKVKGAKKVDLAWSGATGSVIIQRDGATVATVTGSSYTDTVSGKGGGTYTYRVCATGSTTTCSNDVTVTF